MHVPALRSTVINALLLIALLAGSFSPARAAELVMYETASCPISQRFHKEMGSSYGSSKGGQVFPLRRANLGPGLAGVTLAEPITLTPTFVFVDDGREIARVTGYPGPKHMQKIIDAAANAFTLSATPALAVHRSAASPTVDKAFSASSEEEVVKALFGSAKPRPSDRIRLEAPTITMSDLGAQIRVTTSLKDAQALAITVSGAKTPLAAFVLLGLDHSRFSTTLKIDRTATITAHVLTKSGLYSASAQTKVTIGGYGTTP